MKRVLILLPFLLLYSCNQDETEPVDSGVSFESHNEMVALLASAHSQIDPMKIPYHLNSKRADHYKQKLSTGKHLFEEMNYQSSYAYELLLSGSTELSIMELERLEEQFEKNKTPSNIRLRFKRLLGLAYMRLGEQQNCIQKNNEDSCIIPLQGDGIYTMKKGPETAISIFEDILKKYPSDSESKWLYNLAHMAIGEYPEGVPSEWLIDDSNFSDETKVQAFKNVRLNSFDKTELAGGVCLEDFDNDGYLDVFCSSWGVNDQIRYYRNLGNGEFEDRTEVSGLEGITGGLNLIHADYNNDGYKDVFVLRGAWYSDQGLIPNSLIQNNGDGTFSDVTLAVGLLSKNPTQTATWADFNLDGWVDLFIGNESTNGANRKCELYLNKEGRFENITDEAGLGDVYGLVKGVCSGDIDNDGRPDLYISIMGAPNRLFRNESLKNNGILFKDVSVEANVQEPIESFPCWMWDYNNDGYLDIFAAPCNINSYKSTAVMVDYFDGKDAEGTHLMIHRNNGDGSFSNVAPGMNITEPIFAMGANYFDINNDGDLDFYIGTGTPSYAALVPNKLYLNVDGKSFEDVSYSSRLSHVQKGHGVSMGDIDNDGDQDIFHVLGGAYEGDISKNALFMNPLDTEDSFLNIEFEGRTSNRAAIGLRLKLIGERRDGSTRELYRTVSTGGSFGSSTLRMEIGLGDIHRIKEIALSWPNSKGTNQSFKDIRVNSFIKILEGRDELVYLDRQKFNFEL